jgi:hypothetical protein
VSTYGAVAEGDVEAQEARVFVALVALKLRALRGVGHAMVVSCAVTTPLVGASNEKVADEVPDTIFVLANSIESA